MVEQQRESESEGKGGVQLSSAQLLVKRRVIGAQQRDKRGSQRAFRDAAQRISPTSCVDKRLAGLAREREIEMKGERWTERERDRKGCIENKRERTQERLKSEVASVFLIQLVISVGLIWYTRAAGSRTVPPSRLPACQN